MIDMPQFSIKKAILLWLCFLSFSHFAHAGAKTDVPKQKLDDIHERIESLKKELDNSKEAHAEAADELKQSEQAISEANRKLYELRLQHQKSRDSLSTLAKQKEHLENTTQSQQTLLGNQLYQQYLHGKQNYLQVVLQQQDPSKIAREVHYFSYISKARAELIHAVQNNLSQVMRLNQETTKTIQTLAELKAQKEREQAELQAQKQERSKTLKQLSAQISAQRGEIDKLKRDEKRLSDLIERLARTPPKAKSKRQIAKRTPVQEPSEPVASTSVGNNEAEPNASLDGSRFASLRGKLNLPVRGEVTNRFGAARQDTGVSWKGLFIKAGEGNEVKAIAAGRVVFADWMRGFGNLLIVDHGDGYMSLYGNNQTLLKQAGDTVKGGDAVAAVGNTGGNASAGLYYELRHQSKPVDPLVWSVMR